MTYYGRWTYKFEEAARRGAIAALVVHETAGAGYGWNVVQSPAGENFNIVLAPERGSRCCSRAGSRAGLRPTCSSSAGHDFETVKRQARTARLPADRPQGDVSADAAVDLTRLTSRNVIGKLTGSRYPNETVSYGGHWDAYGVAPPTRRGGRSAPGAADDALGLAAMIEIARKFAAGPRPERTLLFAAWTAEERGLLGSEYYASHPLYPHETMVANLTFDTLQWAGPVKDVVLIGKGQSELEDMLAEEARAQGRYVTPEGHPERGLFYRADHFSLAKRGVPVLLNMALAGAYDLQSGGREAGDRWLDELHDQLLPPGVRRLVGELEPAGAVQEAELFYAIGARLANGRSWPGWKTGSEFGKVRQESAARRSGERG